MSLNELWISLFLSSLLTAVLLNQYGHLCQQHQALKAQHQRQFKQLLVEHMMTSTIRQAGFLPCGSQSVFQIWDALQRKWLSLPALSLNQTQLNAYYMDAEFVKLESGYANRLKTGLAQTLPVNKPILITNCEYTELNVIKSIHSVGSHTEISLSYPSRLKVDQDSYLGRWHHDQMVFKQHSLYFGTKRKELLSRQVHQFDLRQNHAGLIEVNWQLDTSPAHKLEIWPVNLRYADRKHKRL